MKYNFHRVILALWAKRRLQRARLELLPRKFSEPYMLPQLMGTSPTKTSLGSSLYQFIDKIGSLDRPPFWYFAFFNRRLSGENLLSDRFSISSDIRPFSHHQLINDNPKGIKVYLIAMILLGHDLRGHVSGSSAGICKILLSVLFGNTEICHM